MNGNALFLVGMLLSFGAILSVVFMVVQIFIAKKLWQKVEEFTDLCVRMTKYCSDAEQNKFLTAQAYREALAEKEYKVGADGNIVIMPKNSEVG